MYEDVKLVEVLLRISVSDRHMYSTVHAATLVMGGARFLECAQV